MEIFIGIKLNHHPGAYCLLKYCATVYFFAAAMLMACNIATPVSKQYQPVYVVDTSVKKTTLLFGIYPANNPQNLHQIYGPLIDYLNKKMPEVTFQMASSATYEDFDKRLSGAYFHFVISNPYQALEAVQHGYKIYAKMGDDERCKGLIVVKKNGPVKALTDLKNQTISFPAPTAFAATMMPLYYLHTRGMDVNRDIKRLYTISHESSMMSVYLGKTIAAASWSLAWKRFQKQNPEFASKLEVKWETPSLINNACLVRSDVSPQLAGKVTTLLLSMQLDAQGKKILDNIFISTFETANIKTYKPVADFMQKYKAAIR
jgi:phosphonate transport system substrate-binding protein